jgi:hypothetical protein
MNKIPVPTIVLFLILPPLVFGMFIIKYNNDKNKNLRKEQEKQDIYNSGYKQGQIDAINGIIKYELKTLPLESIWIEK